VPILHRCLPIALQRQSPFRRCGPKKPPKSDCPQCQRTCRRTWLFRGTRTAAVQCALIEDLPVVGSCATRRKVVATWLAPKSAENVAEPPDAGLANVVVPARDRRIQVGGIAGRATARQIAGLGGTPLMPPHCRTPLPSATERR
jgi:hypothetical protein